MLSLAMMDWIQLVSQQWTSDIDKIDRLNHARISFGGMVLIARCAQSVITLVPSHKKKNYRKKKPKPQNTISHACVATLISSPHQLELFFIYIFFCARAFLSCYFIFSLRFLCRQLYATQSLHRPHTHLTYIL